jgi:hypothetical protein
MLRFEFVFSLQKALLFVNDMDTYSRRAMKPGLAHIKWPVYSTSTAGADGSASPWGGRQCPHPTEGRSFSAEGGIAGIPVE